MKFFLEKSLDFLDFFIVIFFNLAHGFLVLVLLLSLLVLQILVSLIQIVDVFIFLLARGLFLFFIAFFVLLQFGLHFSFDSIQLGLEFLLFLLPLFHLNFLDQNDIRKIRLHDVLILWVISIVVIDFIGFVCLLLGDVFCLLFSDKFISFRYFFLFNLIDEKSSILAGREKVATVLRAHYFSHSALMREGPTHTLILERVQDGLDLTVVVTHGETLQLSSLVHSKELSLSQDTIFFIFCKGILGALTNTGLSKNTTELEVSSTEFKMKRFLWVNLTFCHLVKKCSFGH